MEDENTQVITFIPQSYSSVHVPWCNKLSEGDQQSEGCEVERKQGKKSGSVFEKISCVGLLIVTISTQIHACKYVIQLCM